jgi:Mrp family chromosome partitioning ATPase
MEKIQKALEKSLLARDAQGGRDDTPSRSRRSAREPADVGGHSSADRRAGTSDPTEISYTRTRVSNVPRKSFEKRRLVAALEDNDLSDTFRILRTRVLRRMEKAEYRSLGILSSVGQEGKSLVACNLAVSLARLMTRTVLLVDLDLRAPSIHTYFNINPGPGILGYLEDGAELSTCLVNPGIERLVLLPNGRPATKSSELLTMPRMLGLAKELRETYKDRIILYDLPPILHTDDALAFMQQVECFLLVVREGYTSERELKQAATLLKGYPLVGTVMNRSTENAKTIRKSRMTK